MTFGLLSLPGEPAVALTRDYARYPWYAYGERGELVFAMRHPLLPTDQPSRTPNEEHGVVEVVSPDTTVLLTARDRKGARTVQRPDGSPYGQVDYFPGRTWDGDRIMYRVSIAGSGPVASQVFRRHPVADPRIRNIAGPAYLEIVAGDGAVLGQVFRYANGFARRVELHFAVPVDERMVLLCSVAEATRWPDLKR